MPGVGEVGNGHREREAPLLATDLKDGDNPRLIMPVSRKGRGERKISHKPVPISVTLATRLRLAAKGKPKGALLLPKPDGAAWSKDDHSKLFARVAERLGLTGTSIYSLRHTMIVRSILRNITLRVIAAVVNSSVGELEKTYSAHIADFADEIARKSLLEPPAPEAANVVALRQ